MSSDKTEGRQMNAMFLLDAQTGGNRKVYGCATNGHALPMRGDP